MHAAALRFATSARSGENDAMTPHLAAYADKIILDALERFAPIAAVTLVFGFAYWLIRGAKSRREDAARKAWIEERRAKRTASKPDGT